MAKQKRPARKAATPPYQVFVSHATADKWIAKVMCERIESTGATFFRDDRDIQAGDDISEEIRRQIKRSQEMVVLLTPQSVGRQWITLEVGAAWCASKRIRIIVVMYNIPADPFPIFPNKKTIPLNDLDQYINELAIRVRSHHERREQHL